MEILVLVGALVTLDVLAMRFGHDSRPLDHHERALDAIRRGDATEYHVELRAFEDELRRRSSF